MNLKRSGINIIIALGHAGIEIDKKIAKEVDDIDIVIGGHTNTFLYSGQCSNVDLIVAITYYRFKCIPVVNYLYQSSSVHYSLLTHIQVSSETSMKQNVGKKYAPFTRQRRQGCFLGGLRGRAPLLKFLFILGGSTPLKFLH